MSRPHTFNKAEVATKAMDLFWEQGFAGSTSSDISRRLGLGMGSIYNAFGSKEGLYAAALHQYRERGLGLLHQALATDGSIRAALHTFMSGRVHEALSDPRQRGCLLMNAIGERLPADSVAANFARDMQQANIDTICDALTSAATRGELRAGIDALALANYLVTVLNGLMVATKVAPRPSDLDSTIEIALSVIDASMA